jgi:hypothetical protein
MPSSIGLCLDAEFNSNDDRTEESSIISRSRVSRSIAFTLITCNRNRCLAFWQVMLGKHRFARHRRCP